MTGCPFAFLIEFGFAKTTRRQVNQSLFYLGRSKKKIKFVLDTDF